MLQIKTLLMTLYFLYETMQIKGHWYYEMKSYLIILTHVLHSTPNKIFYITYPS